MNLKFSQDIQALLEKLAIQPLTTEQVLLETSERSFAIVIGFLVLPLLLPTIPGLSTILGGISFILAIQMALGRKTPWLPKRLAEYQLPSVVIIKLLQNLSSLLKLLEILVRPRLEWIGSSSYIWRLNGFFISWLTFLLLLPIPFTNGITAMPILLFIVATLESDGLLICVSYGLTLVVTLVFMSLFYMIWQAQYITPL